MGAVTMLLLVALVLAGCAGGLRKDAALTSASGAADNLWWRVSFRLPWPQQEEPDFSTHLLIADQVLAPLIAACRDDLVLWRFHRRAARDKAGHIFSFVYYANRKTAGQIRGRIESDPMLVRLVEREIVERVSFTSAAANNDILIESTSDPVWPLEIQQSWPYFVMGVSQSWLDLIARESAGLSSLGAGNTTELVEQYRELNRKVVEKWAQYGRHAYLHHLNALFGYTPVYVHETGGWLRF